MQYGVWVEGRLEGWHTSGFVCKTANRGEAQAAYRDAVAHAESKEYEWVRLLEIGSNETVLAVVDEWEKFAFDDDRAFGFIGG